MAVQQNPAILTSLRNAAGDVVFYTIRNRQYTRARVTPSNVVTTARASVRANLTSVATAWSSTLTQAERTKWNIAAKAAPQNPQRNNRGKRSGWTFFHQTNLVRLQIGLTILTAPPSIKAPDLITSLSVDTLDATTQTVKLAFSGATGSDTYILVYATTNLLAGRSSPNGLTRLIATFPPGTSSPLDLSTAWASRFGTLLGGSRVIFQAATTQGADGHLSARTTASAISTGEAFMPWLTYTDPTTVTFSWRNQGTATITRTAGKGDYLLAPAAGSDNIRGREIAAPATPWSISIGLVPQLVQQDYEATGLYISDGTKLMTLNTDNNNTMVLFKWNSVTSNAGVITLPKLYYQTSPIFFKVANDGTNLTWYWSVEGRAWFQIYSGAITEWLTSASYVGYFVNSTNATWGAGSLLMSWLQGTS